jgi:hypothetical protein
MNAQQTCAASEDPVSEEGTDFWGIDVGPDDNIDWAYLWRLLGRFGNAGYVGGMTKEEIVEHVKRRGRVTEQEQAQEMEDEERRIREREQRRAVKIVCS